MFNDLPDVLTPDEVAKPLRITSSTVINAIKKGKLKAIKVGRLWRIQKLDAIEWLEKGSAGQK